MGVALLLFVSGVTNAGALYPIFLMGVPFTYGVVGLSLIVLVAASYGSGLHRWSAFLLGFAPAVHTGLAVWLWVIAGGCLLIERGRGVPRGAIRWLSAGAAAAGVSYAVHAVMSSGVPGQPVAMDRHYLDAFTAFWDGHRRPVALRELAVLLNGAGLIVSTVWLRTFRATVSAEAALLLRFTQVAAAVSLALVPVTWVPADRMPVPLLVLMPGRVLNIVAMTFPALVLGLCGSSRAAWQLAMMALMAGALLLGGESMFWRLFAEGRPGWVPAIPTHAIAFVAAGGLLIGASAARWRPRSAPAGAPHPPRLLILALRMAAITVFAAAAVVAYRVPERRAYIFIDRTNNVALAAAAAGPAVDGGRCPPDAAADAEADARRHQGARYDSVHAGVGPRVVPDPARHLRHRPLQSSRGPARCGTSAREGAPAGVGTLHAGEMAGHPAHVSRHAGADPG